MISNPCGLCMEKPYCISKCKDRIQYEKEAIEEQLKFWKY